MGQHRIDFRAHQGDLRRDQRHDPDRDQQAEAVEYQNANRLYVTQRRKERLLRMMLGQDHADAEDRGEHQDAHAVIAGKGSEDVGRNDR
jgi:hypothetical protein